MVHITDLPEVVFRELKPLLRCCGGGRQLALTCKQFYGTFQNPLHLPGCPLAASVLGAWLREHRLNRLRDIGLRKAFYFSTTVRLKLLYVFDLEGEDCTFEDWAFRRSGYWYGTSTCFHNGGIEVTESEEQD